MVEHLDELRQRGIRLWCEGDRLLFDGPPGAISEELAATIRRHRSELLRLIEQESDGGEPALFPVDRDGPLRLSFGQERLWALEQLEPGRSTYNLPMTVRLRGNLDVTLLRRSLDELVRRHEGLRTSFPTIDGRPRVRIEDEGSMPLRIERVGSVPIHDRIEEVRGRVSEETMRPFDVAGGPLARCVLYEMGDDDHALHLTMHHLVSDAWSLGIFFRELAALYDALARGTLARLPDLPVQFVDYAGWDRARQRRLTRSVEYWAKRLEGMGELALPSDRPMPAFPSRAGDEVQFELAPSLGAAIARLAREAGATPFMVMLAAYQLLLSRYAGQDDIVVGTPIAGRNHRDAEGVIGFFVNVLAARTELAGASSFHALLQRVRGDALDALTHREVPFQRLVAALHPQRVTTHHPLVRVLFNHFTLDRQNATSRRALSMEPIRIPTKTAKFDLGLHCVEQKGRMEGRIEYSRDLFDRETIERFGRSFVALLEDIVVDPYRPLDRLSILPDADRRLVTIDWSGGPSDVERTDDTIHGRFERLVRDAPDAPALVFERRRLTRRELDERANHLARVLLARGIRPEDRVGVCVDPSLEMVVALLGVLKAGATYVPIEPGYPFERKRFMVEESGAVTVLSQRHLEGTCPSGQAEVLFIDEPLPRADEGTPLPMVAPDRLAYIAYTSGSTGTPRGVEVEHRHLIAYVDGVMPRLDVEPGTSFASPSTVASDLGNTAIYGALLGGGVLHVIAQRRVRDGDAFGDYLRAETIDCLKIMPSHLEALLCAASRPADVLPRRLLVLGGEACSWELWKRVESLAPTCEILNHYGPTETTVGVLTHRIQADDRDRHPLRPPLGRPLPGSRMYVVDRQGTPVPAGVPGELWIGGIQVARGYRGAPALTAKSYRPDPFDGTPGARLYCTGDLVRFRADATIQFLGRLDEQVKIRGYRVEPMEIRARLEHLAEVETCAVVTKPDERHGGLRLIAYVVPCDGAEVDPDALREKLRPHLPEYMVPSAFVSLPVLPLMPNGKLDRRALPDPDDARTERDRPAIAPRTETERRLAAIWGDVLAIAEIGVHDNFFDLSGDSILGIQIIARARKAGLQLDPRDLMQHPTIAELAEIANVAGRDAGPVSTGDQGRGAREQRFALARLEAHELSRLEAMFEDEGIADIYPLSPLQAGMLYHTLVQPDDPSYVMQAAITVHGNLDETAFRAAWQQTIGRCTILRTGFVTDTDQMHQVVCRSVSLPWQSKDWTGQNPEDQDRQAHKLLATERERGFDLARPPLMRFCMVRLGEDRRLFVWTVHHALLDGWSGSILTDEVFRSYAAIEAGRVLELAPLSPFADYIAWLEEQDKAARLAIWRDRFAAWDGPTPLPTKEHAVTGEHRMARRAQTLSVERTAAIRSMAQTHRLTLNTVVQGAWALLLSRYGGRDDVTFGVTVSGRPPELAGVERMVGLLINTLPVRVRVTGGSLIPWLRELQDQQVELQRLSSSSLREIKQLIDTDGRSTALFESIYVFENYPLTRSPSSVKGLRFEAFDDYAETNYPMTVVVRPGDRLHLEFRYDASRFDEGMVGQMLRHLVALLDAMVAQPNERVARLPMLQARERRRMIEDWNATDQASADGACVHERVAAVAARAPNSVAVTEGRRRLTYGELESWSNRLAADLRALGVGPEVIVGLHMDRGVEMVVAMLGILKAGGAYMPLDTAEPLERLGMMLAHASAPVIVASAHRREALRAEGVHVLCLPPNAGLAATRPAAPAGGARVDHLAYVIHTSGSTGRPKGVCVTHRSLANLVDWHRSAYVIGSGDRASQVASLGFDACVWEVWPYLTVGASIHVVDDETRKDPTKLWAWLVDTGITLTFLPTPLAEATLATNIPDGTSLRAMLTGGDRLRRGADAVPFQLVNHYGPTESTVVATAGIVGDDVPPSIGRPIANQRVYVLDRRMEPTPVGVPGELYVGGVGVARGYLGEPALTSACFVPDPFATVPGARLYRTGDIARYRVDGTLEFVGRVDHQFKVRGHRIEPGEIEAALLRTVPAREAVVVAREDESGHRVLVAYVVVGDDEPSLPARLREELRRALPDYMVPAAFVLLEALPRTVSGKLDRRALPAPVVGRDGEDPFAAPRDELEQRLARIWGDLLGVDRIGIHDNFFDLGGDSILAIQLVARANKDGLRLVHNMVFEHPTVAALAAAVADGSEDIVAEQELLTGALPLTPIQHWFFDHEPEDVHHVNQAMFFATSERYEPAIVEQAIGLLLEHHDALRLRFERREDGWHQWFEAPGDEIPFTFIELSHLPAHERTPALTGHASGLQASLDLTDGPLVRVAQYRLGGDALDRLLVIIHHLAADGVSRRILQEDLQHLCEALAAGERPDLPPKTSSFASWSRRLHEHAQTPEMREELSFWLERPWDANRPIPRDREEIGANTAGTMEQVRVALDEEETRRLLKEAPRAYGTQINDMLLTAVTLAVAPWVGRDEVVIDLEGHGRESLFRDLDVSRTVGWFTSMFPVVLRVVGASKGDVDLATALVAVKDQLHAIPNRGVGFGMLRYLHADAEVRDGLDRLPSPEVSFNYLGQFDPKHDARSRFEPASESIGSILSPRIRRIHLIDVTGRVTGGRLEILWNYSSAVHERSTIARLAERFRRSLRSLVAHCVSPESGGVTVSDVVTFGWDRSDLDRVANELSRVRRKSSNGRALSLIEDVYPLSPMQSGILFHCRYEPDAGMYIEQIRLAIEALDVATFRRAWQRAVDRHPVFRTCVLQRGTDEPVQVVQAPVTLPIEELDCRGINEDDRERWIAEWMAEDCRRGFELTEPPLVRLTVIDWGDGHDEVVFTHHHILIDGWSMARVFAEVFRDYAASCRGETLDLPSPPPYRAFIDWLRHQDTTAAERFWRDRLQGAVPTRIDPDGRALAATSGGRRYAQCVEHLEERSAKRLRELARRCHVTLNTAVLAAWSVLLARYGGEDDVVFGATVSGRPSTLDGVESMVGLFINTLPMRVRVPRGEALRTWLPRLQRELVAHREYEFAPLWQVQQWGGAAKGAGLFEALFVFENYPVDHASAEDLGELRVRVQSTVTRTGYPLTVIVRSGPSMRLRMIYDRTRFEEAVIERMLHHFVRLLETLPDRAATPVARLSLVDAAEWQELGIDGNDTAVDPGPETCIHEVIEQQVDERPDAEAAADEQGAITYADLDARANQMARHLIAIGVTPGATVAICVDRSIEMLVSVLGILKAGGAYVPLDPAFPAERLAFMATDAGVRALVSSAPILGRIEPLRAAVAASGAAIVRLDADADVIGRYPRERCAATVSANDVAYVIYTSGSTGLPKGVEVRHAGVVNLLRSMVSRPGLSADDVLLAVTTLSFDIAVLELLGPLCVGGRVAIASAETVMDGRRLGGELRRTDATVMQGTPATWQMLLQSGWSDPRLRMLCGGETLPRPLAEALLAAGGELWNMYGPTETTIWSAAARVASGSGPVSLGRPIANTRIYVLDPDGAPQPRGAPGEIFIGGAGVAHGYRGRPGLTAERFVPDPFDASSGARLYRSGDLGRIEVHGELRFLGRRDGQVKLRGYRIELGEIEAVLAALPGIEQAVALLRADGSGDQQLVAYVTQSRPPTGSLAPAELRAALARQLPGYMVPSAFVGLDALPRTPNGKVDRRAIAAMDVTPDRARAAYVAPRSELESRIAEIWRDVLAVDRVGTHDNFFDLGGHSLRLLRVQARLEDELGAHIAGDLSVKDLFQHPTVAALAQRLTKGRVSSVSIARRRRTSRRPGTSDDAIAVIGMAGRFPGAADIETFWRNLRNGVESVRRFTDDELRNAGVDESRLVDPGYVKSRAVFEDADQFDAWFFGYTPREAELIDPQQRVFLECAWEAVERAGYDPRRSGSVIGVWAGTGMNTYLGNIQSRPDLVAAAGGFQTFISNDKDFLPTRVSYKLDLRGPSVNVQTACSTSLVAVHEACQALLEQRCDIALAGGVSVRAQQTTGYLAREGGILSPDGHCRAFDAQAGGTHFGNGVGIVVLKRLEEAIADGDQVRAVIRGTAVNNDGANKVGYTAPSVEGQAEVIALAQAAAGIDADTVTYVEAHGTGTPLGDPIELAALREVFEAQTDRRGFCGIGSLKTNVGHLDAAAGVAGLIKTILALEHGELPPSLHFETPNPEIDFERSPFYVVEALRPWEREGDQPRRAGVSSFGIGGTNAHAIVEEAPVLSGSGPSRDCQLLVLSAKSEQALETATADLATYLGSAAEPLADVAYTLQVGRGEFEHRRAIFCHTVDDAVAALRGERPEAVWMGRAPTGERHVTFMFPGQGAQYVNMGRGLYQTEPVFRETVDHCFDVLARDASLDMRPVLYPDDGAEDKSAERLTWTGVAQPALFTIQYALARLWQSWGLEPEACIGHSIGEFTAACIAEVLDVEDALRLVALRGRLMARMPTGAMLAIPVGERRARDIVDGAGDLWLSAVNGPSLCVVSGGTTSIETLHQRLAGEGVECRRLQTSHAFHSGLMADAIAPFVEAAGSVRMSVPRIPYVSNVTGDWISPEELEDPTYWGRHMREPVRFASGLETLLASSERLLLEVGPGGVLGALARQQPLCGRDRVVVASMRHAKEPASDAAYLTKAIGRLWVGGARFGWSKYHAGERRRRVQLPTYPFQRDRYWIEPRRDGARGRLEKRQDIGRWFYVPVWKPARFPDAADDAAEQERTWLLFESSSDPFAGIADHLDGAGTVVRVVPGEGFRALDGSFAIDPREPDDYRRLLDALAASGRLPTHVVHGWSLSDGAVRDEVIAHGLESVLFLVQALAAQGTPTDLTVVTAEACRVTGGESPDPASASVLGLARVIPQEQPLIRCRTIDVEHGGDQAPHRLVDELRARAVDAAVAYRAGSRWVQSYDMLEADTGPPPVRDGGVYLITGGLGRVGLEMAEALAGAARIKLVLTGRSPFPDADTWDGWLERHGAGDRTAGIIRRLRAVEASGTELMIAQADVADTAAMRELLIRIDDHFGAVHGVIHAAGVVSGPSMNVITALTRDACEMQLRPKLDGLQVIDDLLAGRSLDFRIVTSSLSTVLGGLGMAAYASANACLDAFAARSLRSDAPWLSVDWDAWRFESASTAAPGAGPVRGIEQLAMGPDEGAAAFLRLLGVRGVPQIVVSTGDLDARLDQWVRGQLGGADESSEEGGGLEWHGRPQLSTGYIEPRTDTERDLADVWQTLFGIEHIGVDDNFFDLGGHSLLATQLLNRLSHTYPNTSLSLRSIFDHPTVAALADLIDSSGAGTGDDGAPSLRSKFLTAPGEARRDVLRTYLVTQLAETLGVPATGLEDDTDLTGFDFESLIAELMWVLKRDLRLTVYAHELREHSNLAALVQFLLAELERVDRLAIEPAGDREPIVIEPPTPVGARSRRAACEARNGEVIFVLSAPRSGSTLLRLMLGGHSKLYAPPELSLLPYAGMRQWTESRLRFFARDTITRTFAAFLNLSDIEAARALLDELTDRDAPIDEVYRLIQAQSGGRALIDKSPDYAMQLETLERAEALFDRPRYVHLVRHPYAVIESLVRNRMVVLDDAGRVDPYGEAERRWSISNGNAGAFLAGVDPDRWIRLRYEDAVNDPSGSMVAICEFLGLDFESSVLDPYGRGRVFAGFGDPDILSHRAIEPYLGEVWRTIHLPRRLSDYARGLAEAFAYELPNEDTERRSATTPAGASVDVEDLTASEVDELLEALLREQGGARGA